MRIKLLLLLLIAICYSLFVNIPQAQAQTATRSANYLNTNPDVPQNLHSYTQSVFIEIASAISCQLAGIDPTNPAGKCLGIDPTTHKIGFVEGGGGAIAVMGSFIADTFYLPINTHQYGAEVAANFGFTKKTYAQSTEGGLGFNALLPTLKMWKAFRNITYMIFTLLFIVVGLGIMFRVKIDPRTAMTLQNQIPRIIIALVFVTFSYAIAGFMVDMMYVSIYVIIGVFAQQGFDINNAVAANPFGAVGGLGGMHNIAYGVSESMAGIVRDIFSGTMGTVVGAMIGTIIGKLVGGSVGGGLPIVGQIATTLVGTIGGALFGNKIVGVFAGVIAYLVIIIAIFSALIRLWFTLIKSYLFIFLTVVFAPFYIATGVIPGKSGIGAWARGMVANLSVFPATVVMFLLGKAFISGFETGPSGTRPFAPPFIGDFTNPDQMASIIGLAIILLTPEIANMIKEALKVTDLKQGAAIGRGLQAGVGVISAPISTFGSKVWGVDPYNKHPKPLTDFVQNKWGKGINWFSKAVRLGIGTQHHWENTDEGREAIEREQERKKARAAQRAARRTTGRRGGGETPPTTPPPPTPPPTGTGGPGHSPGGTRLGEATTIEPAAEEATNEGTAAPHATNDNTTIDNAADRAPSQHQGSDSGGANNQETNRLINDLTRTTETIEQRQRRMQEEQERNSRNIENGIDEEDRNKT